MFRAVRILVLAYVGICILMGLGQRSLIYRPARVSTEDLARFASERHFEPWTNTAGLRIGWRRLSARMPAKNAVGEVVLITHGNGGSAVGREYIADPLQAVAPLDVYILEYPGYGDRPGSPSQSTLLSAAEEAFQQLPASVPVFLVSESLGTGVGAWLAGRHADRVAGACFLVPYDRLVNVARSQMPWWLPVGLLLRDQYPASQWLEGFHGPAAFCVAERDSIVTPAHGLRFHSEFAGPKRLWVLPGLDHNEALSRPVEWWQEVVRFWRENQRSARAS